MLLAGFWDGEDGAERNKEWVRAGLEKPWSRSRKGFYVNELA